MIRPITIDATVDQITAAIAYLRPGAQFSLATDMGVLYLATWESAQAVPTDAEITQAILDYTAAQQQAAQEAAATRQRIITAAQATVGKLIDDATITTAQRFALDACLLYKIGALDRQGRVRPLRDWLNGG